MIQVYVLVSFWDDNGLHKAGTFTEVKEENFDPYYMQKAGGSGDAYTKAETDALLDAKQDDLTAGTNIQISDQDVISATDTGDTVSVTQVQTTGTKIATVTVNAVGTDIYAPEGNPFIIAGAGGIEYIVNGQSFPNQIGFSTPVDPSDLEDAIAAKRPVIIKFSDGIITLSNIFKDVDNKIKGSFVAGANTHSSQDDTVYLKIITVEFREMNGNFVSMYAQDATPSGDSGSSVTKYLVLDSEMQRVKLGDIDGTLNNCALINDDTGDEANFAAVATACAAGKVILAFPANEWLNEDAYAEVDFCGKPVSMTPANNGAIHFVIMTANSSTNFKNVCFTYDGSNWDATVW